MKTHHAHDAHRRTPRTPTHTTHTAHTAHMGGGELRDSTVTNAVKDTHSTMALPAAHELIPQSAHNLTEMPTSALRGSYAGKQARGDEGASRMPVHLPGRRSCGVRARQRCTPLTSDASIIAKRLLIKAVCQRPDPTRDICFTVRNTFR